MRSRNVLESGLGLRGHVGADLDEADVGGAARAAVLCLVDAAGAVAAVDVAAVGHVELGLGRRRPLVAAVAVDPEERHVVGDPRSGVHCVRGGLGEAVPVRVRPLQPPRLLLVFDDPLSK